ncbi:MAG: tryptophan--tRNA ligase [Elusimicrobia bacterium]|nr:tryptophan--tRNA ligase [Elusimicrobiota bacterium]
MNRIFSGVQPTGSLHAGNYYGAVRRWAELDEAEGPACLFCIADYHAITMEHEPARLAADTLNLAAELLACGVGRRGLLFAQSHVPAHMELAWILASVAAFGDLTRMTQFKEKAAQRGGASAALFTYPVLMAADVLAYRAGRVPVGEDQLQHLELARSLARRFNRRYGELFPEPQGLLSSAPRIMSLADPSRKMSKSGGDKHVLGVFEEEAALRSKIRAAVTATSPRPGQAAPGVSNLLLLLEQAAPAQAAALRLEEAAGRLRYAPLKEAVAEALVRDFGPLRERRARLSERDVEAALAYGAAAARELSAETLRQARLRLGLLPLPLL